ncbi:MAG: FliM/FliN family flagellar motor switch protein, partial [Planctomycetota bacterium]
VQIVPPNEVVVLISFELTLGECRGMMNLCIPFNTIERIGGKLSANSWVTFSKKPPTPESVRQLTNQLTGAVVEVVAELAETHIATADLINLRVGDIIATEKDIHLPVEVKVEGQPKYHATAGAYKGRKAIQVTAAVEDDDPAGVPEEGAA